MLKKAVILNDTSKANHYGCKTVIKNLIELLLDNGITTINTCPLDKNWRHSKEFTNSILESDIVLVNGEGTLHHSQDSAMDLVVVGKFVKENLDIPVVLINASIQDNNNLFYDYLKYFDLIFTRDSSSKIELLKYGINSKVVPDISFYATFDLSKKKRSSCIGVTDCISWDLSKKLCEFSEINKYYFLPILTSIKFSLNDIDLLSSSIKYYLIKSFSLVARNFNYPIKYAHKRTLFYEKSYEDYIQKIANLDYLVVARYHALCFCLKTLTPFTAIASVTSKMDGMLTDIGVNSRIKTFEDLTVDKKLDFSLDEKNKIEAYVNQAPKKIVNMFAEISQLIKH
jgi:polysaccharide pyruvyl transferase WcaK-like protein